MESRRRKVYLCDQKPKSTQNNNPKINYEAPTKYSYFKPTNYKGKWNNRSYKKRNDFDFRPKTHHKSGFSFKKTANEVVSKRQQYITPEDAEEEARRKKISDVANKLLNKIKLWSAEGSINVNSNQQESNSQQVISSLISNESKEGKISDSTFSKKKLVLNNSGLNTKETKQKRIAHSINKKKINNFKKNQPKCTLSSNLSSNSADRCKVNTAAVRNLQNHLQHKLINEIMLMPKDYLQNMLNDPKINPRMQLKISHLVRENRLLIAQKLRTLAESKMLMTNGSKDADFLCDIDKMIDPVMETDLSALPYEFIKQMENIFQIQFEHSENDNNISSVTQNPETCDLLSSKFVNDCIEGQENNLKHIIMHSTNFKKEGNYINERLENNFDPQFENEECSENENTLEVTYASTGIVKKEITLTENIEHTEYVNSRSLKEEALIPESNKLDSDMDKNSCVEDLTVYECSTDEDEEPVNIEVCTKEESKHNLDDKNDNASFNFQSVSNQCSEIFDEEYPDVKKRKVYECSEKKNYIDSTNEIPNSLPNKNNLIRAPQELTTKKDYNSISCQTECNVASTETQTIAQPLIFNNLYGVPIPREYSGDNKTLLLEEVDSIQQAINKLNERRLMIFLKLARIDFSNHSRMETLV